MPCGGWKLRHSGDLRLLVDVREEGAVQRGGGEARVHKNFKNIKKIENQKQSQNLDRFERLI